VLLGVRLGEPMAAVTGGGALQKIVLDVITYFEHLDRDDELILAAAEARPKNRALRALADQRISTPLDDVKVELQQVLAREVPDFEPVMFRSDEEELEPRVCVIEMKAEGGLTTGGTGFLVGPDLVLTAYHVLRPAIDFAAKRAAAVLAAPADVRFRFDYKLLRDGRTLSWGVYYDLHETDWLAASSPGSPLDVQPEPKPDPDPAHLDFALVRLDAPAGEHGIGVRQAPEARAAKRGWIELPAAAPRFIADTPLLILHYPEGKPLKLAIRMQSVVKCNDNGSRLKHRTNTDYGSSGAPCFDARWNLVALHQGTHTAPGNAYNQAVPIDRIAAALRNAGARAASS
jgi:V8-like Glu-specific endopeptidase